MQRQIRCEHSLQDSMAWMGTGSSLSMGCNDQSCEVAYKQTWVLQGRRKGEPAWEGACPSVPRQWSLTSQPSDPLPRTDRGYHPPLKSGMPLVQSCHLAGLKTHSPGMKCSLNCWAPMSFPLSILHYSGLGLGLPLCHRQAMAMGTDTATESSGGPVGWDMKGKWNSSAWPVLNLRRGKLLFESFSRKEPRYRFASGASPWRHHPFNTSSQSLTISAVVMFYSASFNTFLWES